MATKKDVAKTFLQLASSGRVREAYTSHVSRNFRHHNPFFDETAEALMKGMEENARQNPEKQLDILHVLEDGNFVAVHSRVLQNPSDRGGAVVHLFRFENDRIAELWDIGQPVPETSVNASGMF